MINCLFKIIKINWKIHFCLSVATFLSFLLSLGAITFDPSYFNVVKPYRTCLKYGVSCKVHCFNMIWEISRIHVADNNMSHSLTNWWWHLNVANILQNYSNNILFSIFESWKESKLFLATDSNLIARHWSTPPPLTPEFKMESANGSKSKNKIWL